MKIAKLAAAPPSPQGTGRNAGHPMNVRTDEQDIAYGRHSGIPECCITQFVNSSIDERIAQNYAANKMCEEEGRTPWNYMPCDECLKTLHRVDIHLCYPGCGIEDIREECGIADEHLERMFSANVTEIDKTSFVMFILSLNGD